MTFEVAQHSTSILYLPGSRQIFDMGFMLLLSSVLHNHARPFSAVFLTPNKILDLTHLLLLYYDIYMYSIYIYNLFI